MVTRAKLNGSDDSDDQKLENVLKCSLIIKDFVSNFPQVRFKSYRYIWLEV